MTNSPDTTERETGGVFSNSRMPCQYAWFEMDKHAAGRSKESDRDRGTAFQLTRELKVSTRSQTSQYSREPLSKSFLGNPVMPLMNVIYTVK